MKKLVTAGCSFTIDNYQKTWADYVKSNKFNIIKNYPETKAHEKFVSDIVIPRIKQW